MRLLPLFLLGVLVVLGGVWLSSFLRSDRPGVLPRTAAAPRRVEPAGPPEETPPPRVAPAAEVSVPALSPLAALEREFEEVWGIDGERERSVLLEIADLGTEEAREFVVEALENPGLARFRQPETRDQRDEDACWILSGARDSRAVYRFAVRAIEGLAGRCELDARVYGYHALVARNGGKEGALLLCEHLSSESGTLRLSAANAVAELRDHSHWAELLELAVQREDLAPVLLPVVLGWPDVDFAELFERFFQAPEDGAEQGAQRLERFLSGIQDFVDLPRLQSLLDLHARLAAEGEESSLRKALHLVVTRAVLRTKDPLDEYEAGSLLVPFVVGELESGVADRQTKAAELVLRAELLRVPKVRDALLELSARGEGLEPKLRALVAAALQSFGGNR